MNPRRALHCIFAAFAIWWYLLAAGVGWSEWERYFRYERLHAQARGRCEEAVRSSRSAAGTPVFTDELGRLRPAPSSEAACGELAAFVTSRSASLWAETAFLAGLPLLVYLAGIFAARWLRTGARHDSKRDFLAGAVRKPANSALV